MARELALQAQGAAAAGDALGAGRLLEEALGEIAPGLGVTVDTALARAHLLRAQVDLREGRGVVLPEYWSRPVGELRPPSL